jgi:hypothetical protein
VYIRHRDFATVARLWAELSEFPASQASDALTYCLERLKPIVGASNAAWLASTRHPNPDPADAMRGWWPQDIRVLHNEDEHLRQDQAILERFR